MVWFDMQGWDALRPDAWCDETSIISTGWWYWWKENSVGAKQVARLIELIWFVFECLETSLRKERSKCNTKRFSSGKSRTEYWRARRRRSLFSLIEFESNDVELLEKCSLILRNRGDNLLVNKHSGKDRKYCLRTSETSYGLKSSNWWNSRSASIKSCRRLIRCETPLKQENRIR